MFCFDASFGELEPLLDTNILESHKSVPLPAFMMQFLRVVAVFVAACMLVQAQDPIEEKASHNCILQLANGKEYDIRPLQAKYAMSATVLFDMTRSQRHFVLGQLCR